MRLKSTTRGSALLLAASAVLAGVMPAAADEKSVARELSTPFKVIAEKNRSYRVLFDAIIEMTPPPMPVGDAFNPNTVWPKMAGWEKVSAWAKANESLGKALLKAQEAVALGMPYGSEIEPKYQESGLCVKLGEARSMTEVEYLYLNKMLAMSTYSVAEMYRLGEEGKFDDAFAIGVATMRVLRQACDQRTLKEKVFFMELLCDLCAANRDFMWTYLNKIPVESFQKASLKGYSFLRQTDNERLQRLEMPEGDRVIQEAVLKASFGANGQADPDSFAKIWGGQQAKENPLMSFGSTKYWRTVATVHGSLDASEKRLEFIYDDWWRRWRMRPFDPVQEIPTVLSKTNKVKYAAVMLSVTDLAVAFDARFHLITEVNGTALAASLCGYYRSEGDVWPTLIAKAFPTYGVKRMNYDPFDPHVDKLGLPDNGPFEYRRLAAPVKVITEWGEISVDGCILYAKGFDHHDDHGSEHSRDGKRGDLVVFPPPRALARAQGILK